MIPALPASVNLFVLSFVMFTSLLFLATLRMNPALRTFNWAGFGASQYEGRGRNHCRSSSEGEEEEAEDCAVCLCRLQVGDEIKELGCDHVFHMVCFNRWVAHCRYATCPLCRRLIASTKVLFDKDGVEMLTFRLWDFSDRDRGSNWWLR